jgi:hypothetical protein
MSRATDQAFDALHALLIDSMADELRRNWERAKKPRMIPDPNDATKLVLNPEWEPLSPKLLGVIRAALKDNGIDTPATSKRFDSLLGQLKDMDPDEMANLRPI